MQSHAEIIMNLGYIGQQRVLVSNLSLRKGRQVRNFRLNYCSLKKNKVKETCPELV